MKMQKYADRGTQTGLLWSKVKNWILSVMKTVNLREISVPVLGPSFDKRWLSQWTNENGIKQLRPGSSLGHRYQVISHQFTPISAFCSSKERGSLASVMGTPQCGLFPSLPSVPLLQDEVS